MDKEIYLIRHAQSLPTSAVHHSEWPLSGVGVRQAARLAEVLHNLSLDCVYSSPFRRCVDTIAPLAERAVLGVELHEGLRERLIAHTLIDDFADVWRRSWDDFEFALSGCEPSSDAQLRMVQAVHEICAHADGRRIGVSTHGNVIGLLLHALDPAFGREATEELRNPEVLRLTWSGGVLRRDPSYRLPGLESFATHYSETPYER